VRRRCVKLLWPLVIAITVVIMAALRRKRGHYIFALWLLLSSFFSFSLSFAHLISAVADWMSAILVCTHGVALVRI